jgi:predicted small secreted protein
MKSAMHCLSILVLASCVFWGCSTVRGSIKDTVGNTTIVNELQVAPSGSLKILDGDSERSVALSAVKKLTIDPSVMKSWNGDLFYSAVIVFRDNTAEALSFGSENKHKNVYVALSNSLRGLSKGGNYTINLDKVLEIELLY